MRTVYETVMDPEKNPLSKLPKAQRFQMMSYLGIMWSTLFTFGIGYWAVYEEIIVFHVLLALAATFTGTTFANVSRPTHRDVLQRSDGTPKYDGLWGAP